MELNFVKYEEDLRMQWDEFVENSMNGNFLHKRSFYDSNPLNKNDDFSFLIYKKEKIIALIPGIILLENGIKVYYSHKRSTYGGILFNRKMGVVESITIIQQLKIKLKEIQVEKIFITQPFKILYTQISEELEYSYWYNDFLIADKVIETYIDLDGTIEDIRKKYDNGTKYNIKKALKFVSVRKSNISEISEFWPILESNLRTKHNKKPVHSLSEIQSFISKVGEENVLLFSAYQNEILIASCLVFKIKDFALHAQYIGQDDTFQEYRPINAVLDYIVEWGVLNEFKVFNLGTANEGGKVLNEGLFHFKESFGGRGVLRETYTSTIK